MSGLTKDQRTIFRLEQIIIKQNHRIGELFEHNNTQLAENRNQRRRIAELEKRIAELEVK